MNAASAQRDVVTMIHEGGHAVHSFLSRDLDLTSFKNLPSEVAELASMSMELLSMDNWNAFYDNQDELNRAKKEQLVGILRVLPWIATIDAFQHWIYENPTHSREERKTYWKKLQEDYGNPFVDWAGYEESRTYAWHRQLHLFEVPFYYIEYGISQLGAIGVWKNALQNKEKAIADYKAALALGYTKDIPTIYETANLKFDFSSKTVQSLAQFVQNELKKVS
jgi:oligoendopeptidase F